MYFRRVAPAACFAGMKTLSSWVEAGWVRGLLAALLAALAAAPAHAQNVGIGTTAPTQALDVNGQLRVRGLSGDGPRLPQVQADGTLGLLDAPLAPASDPSANNPVLLNDGSAHGTNVGHFLFGLALSGTTAYTVGSNTVDAFDVSNPASPQYLSSTRTASFPFRAVAAGGLLCVANIGSGSVDVFDISTPASPVLRSTVTVANVYSIALSGPMLYCAGDSLQVVDLRHPASPVSSGRLALPGPAVNTAVSGTTVYVLLSAGQLMAVDVHDPANPALLSTCPVDGDATDVAVAGTVAYVVSTSSNALQLIDLSDPARPVPRGRVATGSYPLRVAVSGPAAYVLNYYDNTIQVFDVSNPASPVALGRAGTGANPYAVAVSGNVAYEVNYASHTLQAFQVSSLRTLGLTGGGGLSLTTPQLSLTGQTLRIGGGNAVTLPSDNLGNHTATQNLNLGTYQLVGNGGSAGLGISSRGAVGLGISSPVSQLANTSQNIIGSDNFGINGASLTWSSGEQGYAGAFYNSASGVGSGGLAVKVATTSAGTAALDVSQGTSPTASGTSLLRVRADGNVGIGTGAPSALLDVAGSTRLRGLAAGVVVADASGNLSSGGDVRLGAGTPRGRLDVPSGDSYLVADATSGSGQTLYLPGHLFLAPYSGSSGTAYVQARVPSPGASTRIGLTLRTTNGPALVDALVLAADGTAMLAGPLTTPAVTAPATGAANLLAAGYGSVFSTGALAKTSGNVTIAHTAGTGEYQLTFTGPLATADFGSTAVALTVFNGPGFASYASGGAAGRLLVRTYSAAGALTDRGFSFVIFQP